jgi:hypothetical protein
MAYVHCNTNVVCLRQVGWAGHVTRIGENTKYFEHLIEKSHRIISKITLIGEGNIKLNAGPGDRAV